MGLLGVGPLATVAITVYVTTLARQALRRQTTIEETDMKTNDMTNSNEPTPAAPGRPRSSLAVPTVTIVMLVVAACAHQRRDALAALFGPGAVTPHEVYQRKSDGPKFDHSVFDVLLRKHVDSSGWVDYQAIKKDETQLDSYLRSVGNAPFAKLNRDEMLAFLINAYNAFTLRLILDHYPVESIKDIPSAQRWDAKRWRIGTMTLSLNQIEHEQIRPKFAEPRIHFALVCAAIGCPKLRNEAYDADRIEAQLEDQTRYVHSHDRWLQFGPDRKEVRLTKLYDWYGSDFEQVAGSVLKFVARYSEPLRAALAEGKTPRIRWLEYDWKLNDRKYRH